MASKGNKYVVFEYQPMTKDRKTPGCVALPSDTFDKLEEFVLENKQNGTDALELLKLSAKRGIGKTITAQNYVGVVTMNDGTQIEILPKIHSKVSGGDEEKRARDLLLKMLRTLLDAPFKALDKTNVDTAKMNVFEIYIRMFINEVFKIVKFGLKSNYKVVRNNETAIKGKILFGENIKYNFAHSERLFVEYDEYSVDKPENILIKTALEYLYKKTSSQKNKTDIKLLLACFADVSSTADYKSVLSKCKTDRTSGYYKTALIWCEVFLAGKSFTSFSGSTVAYSLLFPMEKLFESYVAKLFKKTFSSTHIVKVQDKRFHLFDNPKKFLLKPDIVLKSRKTGECFIFDTKWKKLQNNSHENYGISQADMYQMYAYGKKYKAENVTLIYPQIDSEFKPDDYNSGDGVVVHIKLIDLLKEEKEILEDFNF